MCRFLPDSFATLRLAKQLQRAGDLPASLALLAVENPLLDHTSRLERKARMQSVGKHQALLAQHQQTLHRASTDYRGDCRLRQAHRRS